MGKNKKGKSMRKRKLKRRLKRILENNRKTVGKGWDTQKISRRGEEKEVFRIHGIHFRRDVVIEKLGVNPPASDELP